MTIPTEYTLEEIEKKLRKYLADLDRNIEERKEVLKMFGGKLNFDQPSNDRELMQLEKAETLGAWEAARHHLLGQFPFLATT